MIAVKSMLPLAALEPLPAQSPLSGALWTVVVPILLFLVAFVATFLLYRHFSRD